MKKVSIFGTILRIFGFLILILVLLIIVAISFMVFVSKSNNAYKGDFTKTLTGSSTSAQKALVVYQPAKSKSSAEIAEQIAKGLQDSGYEVTLTYPGKHVSDDISAYSVVAFGSPVFMGSPSTMVTDTISRIKEYTGKTVILYSVGASEQAIELETLAKALNDKKADYTSKFIVNDKDKDQKAYDLGLLAGKESEVK